MKFPANKPKYFHAGMCGSCVYCPGYKEIRTTKQSYCAAGEERITLISHKFAKTIDDLVAMQCSMHKFDMGLGLPNPFEPGVKNPFEPGVKNSPEVQGVAESLFEAFLKDTMDSLIKKMIKNLEKEQTDE